MFRERVYTQVMSNFLGKIGKLLPFTPNGLTFLTVIISGIAFYFATVQNVFLTLLFFILACLLDTIDGALGRLLGTTTKLGAFLDGSLDRFTDFFLVFSFFFFNLPSVFIPFKYMMFTLVYFTLMPTFIVAYANHRGAVDDPEEKKVWRIMNCAEMRVAYFIALGLAQINPLISSYILFTIMVLNIITSFQTIYLGIIKSEDRDTAFKIFRK